MKKYFKIHSSFVGLGVGFVNFYFLFDLWEISWEISFVIAFIHGSSCRQCSGYLCRQDISG